MPTWFDNTLGGVLDSLLDDIVSRANTIMLVSDYTQGEDYATVTGRNLGSTGITGGNFTGPTDGVSSSRVLTFTGASTTASASDAAPPDLHIVLTNGSDTILAVTDETSDQAIVSGNTLNFPSFTLHALQPTQVA